jgi:hypothetical protein
MSNQVRATDDGLARIAASLGASTFHGITVQGHCMGIVARTWRLPSQPAGYGTAYDGARAVQSAGRMRTGTNPPVGAVAWWAHRSSNNRPGHVATINRPGFCLGNVGATIQEAALSRFSGLRWLGWSWPADVPGWGPAVPPTPDPGDDMPLTNEDIDRIARRVWEFQLASMWDGQRRTAGNLLSQSHYWALQGGVDSNVPTTTTDTARRGQPTSTRRIING